MIRVCASIALLFSLVMMSSGSHSQDATPIPEGPYFGQTPPGSTPEAFAPGIVSTEHYEYGGVFTPDMKEFYFIRDGGKYEKSTFVVLQNQNNRWVETIVSPRVGQPFIAPDGKTMHLGRRYMERTEAGWSERKDLGAPFDDILIMRLTASAKGTYVFDQIVSDGKEGYDDGPIRSSRLVKGKREEPKVLSKAINTGKWNSHPFIAPDESYILWDSQRDGGYGDSDIYISYRQQDGSWGPAVNLGDKINTSGWDAAASVTPDGKYILFHRSVDAEGADNVDIYWVDAQIIETLRPKP
ncbi:MAG: PD40 domain-containing protein [Kordiimonadaceae bacterium]|nr:PD40 domain-containing protein [Kordiimonadaceae bacterium]